MSEDKPGITPHHHAHAITPITAHSRTDAPRLLLPVASSVFLLRAQRFTLLAQNHSLQDWLLFLGRLSDAQNEAVHSLPHFELPAPESLARSVQHQMPPLAAQSFPRPAAWHTALDIIIDSVAKDAPPAAQAALQSLQKLPVSQIEKLADQVLHTELYGDQAAQMPYVAAALQVLWTVCAERLTAHANLTELATIEQAGMCLCPVCGFLPVASLIKTVGDTANLRYLHCALCNSEWYFPRAQCSICNTDRAVHYLQLEGAGAPPAGTVRAEACDSCHAYLKMFDAVKGNGADAVADDLATLALDILADEAGFGRAGPNLLL